MVGEGVIEGVDVAVGVEVGVGERLAEGMGVDVWVGVAVNVLRISGEGFTAAIAGAGIVCWRLHADKSTQQAASNPDARCNRDSGFLKKAGH
jgi:hypothetical protein